MEPFKNAISPDLVRKLSGHITRVHPAFDEQQFLSQVLVQLDALELKARVMLISDQLLKYLPQNTVERTKILTAILHPDPAESMEQTSDDTGMRGFAVWPLTMIVGQHGLDEFDTSLQALKEITPRFSSEFGIRYLLLERQERVLEQFAHWVKDPDHHVRRLVSEGARPRLPWAQQLPALVQDPSPMLPILEALRDDPSEYVRRSVANHLNDISKDHPAMLAALAKDWMKGADKNRKALLKHACRSLVKAGDPDVLSIFGFEPPMLEMADFYVTPTSIKMGGAVDFSARLISKAQKDQKLIVDYVVHFRKASGQTAPKVFKGGLVTLNAGGEALFKRSLSIRPITTRRYYSGQQHLSLRINGQDFGHLSFELDATQ